MYLLVWIGGTLIFIASQRMVYRLNSGIKITCLAVGSFCGTRWWEEFKFKIFVDWNRFVLRGKWMSLKSSLEIIDEKTLDTHSMNTKWWGNDKTSITHLSIRYWKSFQELQIAVSCQDDRRRAGLAWNIRHLKWWVATCREKTCLE